MTMPYYAPELPGGFGPVDAAGTMVADVPCRKCSYNLRGMTTNGRCPECGTPVGFSTQGDLLKFSDPAYVEGLGRAVTLIIAGVAVIFLGIIAVVALGAAAGRSADPATFAMLGAIVGLGGYVLILIGSWLLTAPDPSGLGEDKYGKARQIVRVALLVGLGNSLLQVIVAVLSLPPAGLILFGVIGQLAGIVSLVGYIAQLYYLERLALRIPDAQLAARAGFLKSAIGITYAIVLLVGLAMQISIGFGAKPTAGTGAVGGMVAFGCIAGIAGLCLLVFMVMYLLMLERLGKRFKEQAAIARQTWAAAAQV